MNIAPKLLFDPATTRIPPFLRGHLFLFDRPQAPTYSPRQGYRLFAIFLLLEGIARPLLDAAARRLGIAQRDWWSLLQLSVLTAFACWLIVRYAEVPLSQLGLYSWLRWSGTEKSYLLQIIPISIVVFSVVEYASVKALLTRPHWWQIGLFIFLPQMIWGFYQEFLYRGILQTELIRRWGTWTGLLVSNLIFTFGPLHAYHFKIARLHPSHLWIFAGIFAIGLFFALIYRRSGNLWIIATMHGIGDWFIDGLAQVSRMAT